MRDEMDSRLWAAHGREFSDDLHALFVSAGAAMVRLTAPYGRPPGTVPGRRARARGKPEPVRLTRPCPSPEGRAG
jgi:hypothetical protein